MHRKEDRNLQDKKAEEGKKPEGMEGMEAGAEGDQAKMEPEKEGG